MRRLFAVCCTLFAVYCSLFMPASAVAQTSPKIKELERQRKNTLEQIDITTRLLSETKQTTLNAIHRMQLINGQINARMRYISLLNEEIDALEVTLKSVESNITASSKELSSRKKHYVASLQKMQYSRKAQDKILFVLSADNFSKSYRRLRYLKEYAFWQKMQAKEIISRQKKLEQQKAVLRRGRESKLRLLDEEKRQRSTLEKEERMKQAEVAGLREKTKELQVDLAKRKKQASALNRQIENAIAEEIARSERERKAAEAKAKARGEAIDASKKRVAETSGGYAMTKEERTLSSDFSNNRGSLPFPVKGQYRIVSHFGMQQHQELKYVTTNNNGIDIQTTPGNDARAVFGGTVSTVFVVPGYNNSVIVRHGNYLTVYSNLKDVYVKVGDRVSTGQAIGRIFTDSSNGNSTILHFELWKEKTKLNPEGWLD
jgi:septal ring factor EnvC (AmiA/AmiB activator)